MGIHTAKNITLGNKVELDQLPIYPIVSVTDCLLNNPHLAIWLWTQLYQSCELRPPVTKMV